MSRMIDRILANGYKIPKWMDVKRVPNVNFEALPVFVIDNVAKYFSEHYQTDIDLVDTFFNTLPPYPDMFIEYRPVQKATYSEVYSYGYRIESTTRANVPKELIEHGNHGRGPKPLEDFNWDWAVTYSCYTEIDKGKIIGPLAFYTAFLDQQGGMVLSDHLDEHGENHLLGVFYAIPPIGVTENNRSDFQKMRILFKLNLPIVQLAFNLLHCQNIHMETHIPPEKVQHKRRLDKKRPLISYHLLTINPLTNQDSPSIHHHTDITKRLHLCRGYFAHYGPQFGRGKLFGKYEGSFWVPAHIRGNKKEGIVLKDYSISPQ